VILVGLFLLLILSGVICGLSYRALRDRRRIKAYLKQLIELAAKNASDLHAHHELIESVRTSIHEVGAGVESARATLESQQALSLQLREMTQSMGEKVEMLRGRWDDFLNTPLDSYVVARKKAPFPDVSLASAGSSDADAALSFAKDFTERQTNLVKQEKFVKFFEGCASILDVGCGKGEFLELCRKNNLQAVGIDFSEEKVQACREHDLEAYRADAFSFLRETDRRFDGVMCSHIIEHLGLRELLDLTRLVSARLNDGGKFVIVTPNARSLQTQLFHFWKDMTHHRLYDIESLCHLLERSGFEIVEAGEYDEVHGTRNLPV